MGSCIPTFFAATTFDGAAYETMFRDPPGKFSGYPHWKIRNRRVSVISPKQELRLVGFFTPELVALGVNPVETFAPCDNVYPDCRCLAEMAWRDNPGAHGIIWSSVRDSFAHAMLMFGDRLAPSDFTVLSVRMVETDPSLLVQLDEAATRCGSFISK